MVGSYSEAQVLKEFSFIASKAHFEYLLEVGVKHNYTCSIKFLQGEDSEIIVAKAVKVLRVGTGDALDRRFKMDGKTFKGYPISVLMREKDFIKYGDIRGTLELANCSSN